MSQTELSDSLIGTIISERYRVLERIGRGGFGAVYKVQHIRLDKILALKVLFEHAHQNPRMIKRFEREARATCRIGHDNIVEITDFARDRSVGYYFVMELLEGETLAGRLDKLGPMQAARIVHIGIQVADALAATHHKGIIHRDLKPENVFLTRRRDHGDFVKVVDFGIASMVDFDEHEPRLTNHGTMLGTPSYMSPEQARGKRVDHRADIYSFGIILYEMATGQVTFKNPEPMAVLEMHRSSPPVPPRQLRPDLDISERLETIILRCLRKSVTQRYQSMREVHNDLMTLGQTLDMSAMQPGTKRVDNEGHQAAELHQREEPEWLDEELLLLEPAPTAPVRSAPQLVSELETTMPMAVPPEVPPIPPVVVTEPRNAERSRPKTSADAVQPKASPWQRKSKDVHLPAAPSPVDRPSADTHITVETVESPKRASDSAQVWQSPVILMLLGFFITFATYMGLSDGFSTDEEEQAVALSATAQSKAKAGAAAENRASSVGTGAVRGSTPEEAQQLIFKRRQTSTGALSGTSPARSDSSEDVPGLSPLRRPYAEPAEKRARRSRAVEVSEAWFRIQSIPDGATVTLNGVRQGDTPVEFTLPKDGKSYNVAVKKDGVVRRRTIRPTQDQVLTLRLIPSEGSRRRGSEGAAGGGNYDLY